MAPNLTPVPMAGEVVEHRGRLAPEALKEQADEIRQLMRSVLQEGVDFGQIPGTPKPTLFKSGAEWLLKWAQLGHRKERVELERDEHGRPYGVTYRCEVFALTDPGTILATADGYCGYDEPDREAHTKTYRNGGSKDIPRSPWNTIIQMAQKRAMVSATLQATAASGLFTQDVVEEPEAPAQPVDPEAAFKAIGWNAKVDHDAFRNQVTTRAAKLSDELRSDFKGEWASLGFVWAELTPRAVADKVLAALSEYEAIGSEPAEPSAQSLSFPEGEEPF